MSTTRPDLSGCRLDGRLVHGRVGRGGVGDVYDAVRLDIPTSPLPVVLKCFLARADDPTAVRKTKEQHRWEYTILSMIKSEARHCPVLVPRAAGCAEVWTDDDGRPMSDDTHTGNQWSVYYIEYERADGCLHNAWLTRYDHGRKLGLFLDDAVRLVSAVEAFHRHARHGDIKEDNFLLFRNALAHDEYVILLADPFPPDAHGGTLTYMAPEVFSEPGTKASDIYALGVTLWLLLFGEKPFDPAVVCATDCGTTKSEFADWQKAHSTPNRPVATMRCADIPWRLADLLWRAMTIAPTERPTATEMRIELEAIRRRYYGNVQQSRPLWVGEVSPGNEICVGRAIADPIFLNRVGLGCYFVFLHWKESCEVQVREMCGDVAQLCGQDMLLAQIQGEHDFVVRVATRRDAVVALMERLRMISNGRTTVKAMACESIARPYLASKHRQQPDSNEVLWKLFRAQERGDEAAEKWLWQQGVYIEQVRASKNVNSWYCLCSLRFDTPVARTGFLALVETFRANTDFRDWSITLYRKESNAFGHECEWPDDALLEVVVPNRPGYAQLIVFLQQQMGRYPERSMSATGLWYVHSHLLDFENGNLVADGALFGPKANSDAV